MNHSKKYLKEASHMLSVILKQFTLHFKVWFQSNILKPYLHYMPKKNQLKILIKSNQMLTKFLINFGQTLVFIVSINSLWPKNIQHLWMTAIVKSCKSKLSWSISYRFGKPSIGPSTWKSNNLVGKYMLSGIPILKAGLVVKDLEDICWCWCKEWRTW